MKSRYDDKYKSARYSPCWRGFLKEIHLHCEHKKDVSWLGKDNTTFHAKGILCVYFTSTR